MNKFFTFLTLGIFISIITYGQQIENGGFESWEDVGTVKDEPVDWSTIKTCDDPSIASVAPVTFDRSTDAHTGDYSLKLYNVSAFGLIATGAICNGRFHAEFDLDASYSFTDTINPAWHTLCNDRPDSLVGWFKFFPTDIDRAQFKVILHNHEAKLPENGTIDNWVGMAVYQTEPGATFDSWTRFSVPFDYYNSDIPKFLLCVLNSGDSTASYEGSYLLADDLELIYNNAGIGERQVINEFIHVTGTTIKIDLASEKEYLGQNFRIIDLSGKNIYETRLTSSVVSDIPQDLPSGIYMALMDSGKYRYAQKFYLGR